MQKAAKQAAKQAGNLIEAPDGANILTTTKTLRTLQHLPPVLEAISHFSTVTRFVQARCQHRHMKTPLEHTTQYAL
jgi:hypothetical protein